MHSLPAIPILPGGVFQRRIPSRVRSAVRLVGALCCAALAGAPADSSLTSRLQRELTGPNTSSVSWGAVVARADGSLVFATNAHEAFIPASNTKLFIGALALDRLGPEARLQTPVLVSRPPDAEGTLHSDLWVIGQGDPTPGTAPRSGPGDTAGTWDDALVPWVTRWQSKGLKRIEGDLVLCEAALRAPEYGPGWDEEDRAEWYGAPVSAFVVNDNTFRLVAPAIPPGATRVPFRIEPPLPSLAVQWRVSPGTNATHRIEYQRQGPGRALEVRGRFAPGTNGWSAELAVAQPAKAFGELLLRTLERRGVRVSGTVRVVKSNDGCPEVVWDHWTSEPLARRLALCLKPSQNLHAQLLLAEVGRQAEGATLNPLKRSTPAPGLSTSPKTATSATADPAASTVRRHDEWGLAQLPGLLARVGIADGAVRLEEGSGLSRSNRVTPAATVALLRFMAAHPAGTIWKDSLPVGGVDGTLKHRFKTGRAHRAVRAKTGSLRGVHALGGYVTTAGGEEWVFAIYANQAQGDPQARARMDRFVEVLASAGAEDDSGSLPPSASPRPVRPPGPPGPPVPSRPSR